MRSKTRNGLAETYLTVAQAAAYLGVHASTIRRWIDRGRLPAYRVGDKRIGVRSSDLGRLITPRRPRRRGRDGMPAVEGAAMPRLTRAQQRQGLQILVELERVRDELAARHTELGPESWELLNDSRSERARDLLRAAEE